MSKYDELRDKYAKIYQQNNNEFTGGQSVASSSVPAAPVSKYDTVRQSLATVAPEVTGPSTEEIRSNLHNAGIDVMGVQNTFRSIADAGAKLKQQEADQKAAQKAADKAKKDAAQKEIEAARKGRNIPVIGHILKGLDWVEDKTKPAADIAQEYYTPGAGLNVLNSATTSAGNLISKLAPGLAGTVGGRIASTALREAAVGAPAGAGQALAQTGDLKKAGEGALYGGLTGGALGALGRGTVETYGLGKRALGSVAQKLQGGQLQAIGNSLQAIDDVVRQDLPQTVRRVTSPDRVPEVFPERFRRTVGSNPLESKPTVQTTAKNPVPEPIKVEQPIVQGSQLGSEAHLQNGFASTLKSSEKTPQGFKEKLQASYTRLPNEETLSTANKRIAKDVEEATSYALGDSRFTAEKATVAQRLIDHYNGQGNYQRAVDIAQKVSEEATRAGQSIQALSMFDKLTPEGVLIHAQRLATKANENTSIFARDVKVTPEMASDLTQLAQSAQKMTGVKDLSNDVMTILDKAKSGEKLTESETHSLQSFVRESKQFVKEVSKQPKAPTPPKMPSDKRVSKAITSYLDAQEQAAKERLRSRGIRISSTPLDTWADYAVIGASKMGKGIVKFADWSEQMVKDLGEDIRPHLQNLYDRSKEMFTMSTKKVTEQTISQAERLTEKVIKTKELSGPEADSLRTLAQKVSGLSGDAKRIASQDLQKILQQLDKPTVLKKISSAQTIAQLLNPKTHVRNVVGNEMFYRLERIDKLLATPIDIARSKITGGPRSVTFRTNNQGEFWKNWFIGLKAGWNGTSINGLNTQYDLASQAFKSKYNPVTYLEKSLGAALRSFDTAAYMRAYNNSLGEQATLRAINEGQGKNADLIQKYIREADDNMMKIADEYGKYVTFQDSNAISTGLTKLKRGLNANKDFGLGDLVLKYPKTPGALLMRALEYSPAGFIRSASILAKPLFKQEANTAEVTQALTRAIIGMFGLSGMGYFLLDKGVLTGSASKDKDIRDLQRSAGQGQYQVNLSALTRLVKSGFKESQADPKEGDFFYTYDWAQPASMAVSMGANTAKMFDAKKQSLPGLAGAAYNSVEGGLGTLTEQSVLSGLKSAVQGYPGQTTTDKLVDILGDIPSSFVPTLLNQIRQVNDNNKRETYSDGKLEKSLNTAQAKIPGLASRLPQQYDTLGNPKTTNQTNSLFNIFLNPGAATKYKLSPEAKYIVDLISQTGDETLAPRVPGKNVTIDGQSFKLNGDMFSRFQQLQGEEINKRVQRHMNNDKSLKGKAGTMEKDLDAAGKAARKQLVKEIKR